MCIRDSFEDDVELRAGFRGELCALVDELERPKELGGAGGDWDVCLLGAFGCARAPEKPMGLNNRLYLALLGGRKRRRVSPRLHVPARPAGARRGARASAASSPSSPSASLAEEAESPPRSLSRALSRSRPPLSLAPSGTHAYLVSKRGAARLLRAFPQLSLIHI